MVPTCFVSKTGADGLFWWGTWTELRSLKHETDFYSVCVNVKRQEACSFFFLVVMIMYYNDYNIFVSP